MPARSKKPWFPVKRLGYGVGLPIAWEGWLVFSLYVAIMILTAIVFSKPVFAMTAIPLTAAFVYIAYTRSDGEWRYRNGE